MIRWPSPTLVFVGVLGGLLFAGCDRKTPMVARKTTSAVEKASKLPPEAQFNDARTRIAAGNYSEAATILRQLDASGKAPAQLQHWITVWAGLAELLADREEEARPVFATLAERASAEGGKLAMFLADVGKRLSGEEAIPSKITPNYNLLNYEAIALFLYGLKDEKLGAFDDALTFYRQFTTASAKGVEPWSGFNAQLRHFQQLALNIVEYEDLVDTATRARKRPEAVAEASRALEAAKVVRKRIKQETKLIASLDEALGEKSRMSAEEDEADAKVFPAVMEKWTELSGQHDFAGARQAILEPRLKTSKAQKEQDFLAARTGYLEQFKFYLVLELNATGYPKPITLKNGTTVPGGIAKMDDTHVHIQEEGSVKLVPWSEVSSESIFEVAKSLITPNEAPDAAAFRKWHLGNYAAFIGKIDEARALMTEAAQANPSYAPEIALLLGK